MFVHYKSVYGNHKELLDTFEANYAKNPVDAIQTLRRKVTELEESNRVRKLAKTPDFIRVRRGLKVLFLIASSNASLSLSDNPWLNSLANEGQVCRNLYSRRTIGRLIPTTRSVMKSIQGRRLRDVLALSGTFDGWQDVDGTHHQSLTLHYVSDNWQFVSEFGDLTPSGGTRSGERIAETFNQALSAVTSDFTMLGATTADGASNEVLAGQLIHGEGCLNALVCMAHTIQLIVRAATDQDYVKRITSKIHFLVMTIKRHRHLRETLASLCVNFRMQAAMASFTDL
jgi:hypothetical protein